MYEQVGRKNAKSQTLAGITTYELAPYGVLGSEVYCLAPVSKQAKAVFKEAINMINGHRILKGNFILENLLMRYSIRKVIVQCHYLLKMTLKKEIHTTHN